MSTETPGQQIIAGLRDAVAHAKGDETAATVHVVGRPAVLRDLADRCERGATSIEHAITEASRLAKMTATDAARVYDFWCARAYLDAVASLTEAALPGWRCESGIDAHGQPWSRVRPHPALAGKMRPKWGHAPTEPLARLAALLRAMAADIEHG